MISEPNYPDFLPMSHRCSSKVAIRQALDKGSGVKQLSSMQGLLYVTEIPTPQTSHEQDTATAYYKIIPCSHGAGVGWYDFQENHSSIQGGTCFKIYNFGVSVDDNLDILSK